MNLARNTVVYIAGLMSLNSHFSFHFHNIKARWQTDFYSMIFFQIIGSKNRIDFCNYRQKTLERRMPNVNQSRQLRKRLLNVHSGYISMETISLSNLKMWPQQLSLSFVVFDAMLVQQSSNKPYWYLFWWKNGLKLQILSYW